MASSHRPYCTGHRSSRPSSCRRASRTSGLCVVSPPPLSIVAATSPGSTRITPNTTIDASSAVGRTRARRRARYPNVIAKRAPVTTSADRIRHLRHARCFHILPLWERVGVRVTRSVN